jgi:hypothetical protein
MLHLGQFEELAKLPPLDEHMYCILTNDETALRAEWKYRHGTIELIGGTTLNSFSAAYKYATEGSDEQRVEERTATHMASFMCINAKQGKTVKFAISTFAVRASTACDVFSMTAQTELFAVLSGMIPIVVVFDGASINHKAHEAMFDHDQLHRGTDPRERAVKVCTKSRFYPDLMLHGLFDFPHSVSVRPLLYPNIGHVFFYINILSFFLLFIRSRGFVTTCRRASSRVPAGLMKPPALRRVDTRTESKARQNRTTRTTRLSQAVEESREREATLMQEVELALLVEEERPRRPKDLTRSL